ncbi:cardiolipin synthase [Auritidibacter ignavus]|uniref:cardiolipin synthase n=1 Tax=Auritidibacter ignavus TaxID=678932 RepID=UPI0024472515|nr:cardiolipin synthase [Auritidibacter ignavus]WGH90617.1 cardiolipin synthase [Auritidibacter ignavus]
MYWTLSEIADWPIWLAILVVILDLGIRILLLGIVPGNRRPAVAMAWLLVIFFLPWIGVLLFLLLGSFKLGGQRRSRQKAVNEELRRATAHWTLPDQIHEVPQYVESSAALTRQLTGFPMLDGNSFQYYTDYRNSLHAMAQDIDRAHDYVNMMFYICAVDPVDRQGYSSVVFDALIRAKQRGVTVRVLFDHIASLRVRGYRDLLKLLREHDIEYYRAMPVRPLRGQYQRPDLRNHRKLMVIDGTVAYTGSQNLIEPGYKRASAHKMGREWVDVMARITGPIVASLDIVFATDWYSETGQPTQENLRDLTTEEIEDHRGISAQVIPSGPGFANENNLRAFNHLFYSTTRTLRVVTPYLVPDDSMLYALTTAAQRGVDVEMIVCRRADQFMVHHAQQSYYEALLRSGVRILRYPDPNVLHSKMFTVDDDVAVFGSSNMDMRSFSLNVEVTVLAVGAEIVAATERVMDEYRAECEELTLEQWLARPRYKRWLDNVFRLTSALQ